MNAPEPFAALAARYQDDPEDEIEVEEASLSEAIATGADPWQLRDYVRRFAGREPRDLDELRDAIAALHDEELTAFRVAEGLAVSHASDGRWLLLRP